MYRFIMIASAAAALAACTATTTTSSDPYYRSSAAPAPVYRSASNPPGWVDNNRDGIDDRTQGSRTNPNNPPGWVDRDRDGVDDRVEQRRADQRRTSYSSGGYYDFYGNWRSY